MLARGLIVAALVAVLDQASKWAIIEIVMQPPTVIPVTPFFDLVLHWNRGISFGLFHTGSEAARWVLTLVAVAITAGLIWWLRGVRNARLAVAIGLVIGGAVGNVIDRVRLGAIADFLSFHAAGFYWPAFNVADSCITIGVGLILIDSLFGRPQSRKKG
jgi:signal peptidase II